MFADFEFAAGGIVRSQDSKTIAVVRRTVHQDWTLPKGRLDANETALVAAQREAQEETGLNVTVESFAGTYSYQKNGKPKVVFIWHMIKTGKAYPNPAQKTEIEAVEWMSPNEAVGRLSHATEQEFLRKYLLAQGVSIWTEPMDFPTGVDPASPKVTRLAAAIATVSGRLAYQAANASSASLPSILSAQNCLRSAEALLRRKKVDLDRAWGCLHDAERFLVFAMSDEELLSRATSAEAEAKAKLQGWRAGTVGFQFEALRKVQRTGRALSPDDRLQMQHVVVETLKMLHEDSDNRYHRLEMVGTQLKRLVVMLALLLVLVLVVSELFAPADSPFAYTRLGAVAIAGALGALLSSLFQLSRVGEAKIPEALMQGLITSGRPLVGAASALFIYAVMQGKVFSFSTAEGTAGMLVVAFAAGFSETLVLGAVAKVTANAEKKTAR